MAAPYTETTIVNYNSNPPSDDGAQTAANRVQWSTQKTKLADPLKVAIEAIDDGITTAFGKIIGGTGVTSTSISYDVVAGDQGKLVKVTGANVTITTPDATAVGSPFVFAVLNNSSGDIVLDGSGTQTIDGALTAIINAGAGFLVYTDGTNWFTTGQNSSRGQQTTPQGYLTPTSGVPIITTGVAAGTAVYYTPFLGNLVPIPNGTTFLTREFSELTLTLVSNHVANGIYDVFLFDDSGTLTIGTGPVWNTVTAGSCARGTGAGTTELQRLKGLYTNKVSMTARNSATTYTVAANCGLYVGSISMDGTNGQVSCLLAYGQSRKWSVWNAFNRRQIVMIAGDATSSWSAGSTYPTFQALNASSTNKIQTFCGLPEEYATFSFTQDGDTASTNRAGYCGIGINSVTTSSGVQGHIQTVSTASDRSTMTAFAELGPRIGINDIQMLEAITTGCTFNGTEAACRMKSSYLG